MIAFFKNKEVKVYLLILLVVHTILGAAMYMVFNNNRNRLYQAIVQERVAILGAILSQYPELEPEITPILTEKVTTEEFELGLEFARKYGIDTRSMTLTSPLVSSYEEQQKSNILYFTLLFLSFSIIAAAIILNHIYQKIRNFSHYAETIVEGNFDTIRENQEEGDFAILTVQYNHMAKRLQSSLENLHREKIYLKNIVSDISHQLKTPLASIKMFNELLIDGEIEEKENAVEFLEKSQSQIERMEWLIKNLLKMARLETNSVEFKNENLPINETIKKATEPLSEKWKEKKQQLLIKSHVNIKIKHDQDWMAEAISNVLKNAIEHTPDGGRILIGIVDSPLAIKIQVDNEGDQIPKEDLPYLFERFYKGKNNQKPNSTGIGLALAKAIVENQNGSIAARNTKEGPSFAINLYKYESF